MYKTKEKIFWQEFAEHLPDIDSGEVDKDAAFDLLVDLYHELNNESLTVEGE